MENKRELEKAKQALIEAISASGDSTKELQILLSDLDIKIARLSKRDTVNSEGALKLITQRNTIAKLLKMNFLNDHIKALKELNNISEIEDNESKGYEIIIGNTDKPTLL